MRTSTKVILWAVCVGVGLGIWAAVDAIRSAPSWVRTAVIVDISGCESIDFAICQTVVDVGGVRLSRGGRYGEIGDSLLVVQNGVSRWHPPSARQLSKYEEEARRK